jgi:hypothetical protein
VWRSLFRLTFRLFLGELKTFCPRKSKRGQNKREKNGLVITNDVKIGEAGEKEQTL